MSSTPRKLPLWGVSLIIVLALHLALFLWARYWRPQAMPVELPPAAMLIELEPVAAAPKPAPPPPPPPQVQPQEPEPQPKLVEVAKPKLAIAPPKPKPKPRPPKPVVPKPQSKPRDNPPQETPPAPVAKVEAKPTAPLRAAVSGSSKEKEKWQQKLLSHLAKYKRYPEDARRRGLEGQVRLRFVLDGQGQVLSYALAGRSGSASLDRAALEMIRRAQPLPAPPEDMLTNGKLELVAPFNYSLSSR